MLVILRILFGAGLLYGFYKVRENAQSNPEAGDVMNAFYLAECVIMGILNAIVWAPYFGSKISEPLTSTLTTGPAFDPQNRWVKLIVWCEQRGYRHLTLCLCFLEGVRHPALPAPFVIALRNVRPGGWWERIYAREVFRFSNTQHSLHAYDILKRHGVDPGHHPHPEVNLVLHSLARPVSPEPARIDVPRTPQTMPLRRNPLIQLFESPATEEESAHRGGDLETSDGAPAGPPAPVNALPPAGATPPQTPNDGVSHSP